MIETDAVTVTLPREAVSALKSLAERTERDIDELIAEAVANYLEHQEWIATQVREAIAEIDAGARMIPHAEVRAWVESWGTDNELPMPE